MLGDQTAARESSGDLRPGGCEAEVAHQRLNETYARDGTVDRGDDRLGDREREGLRAQITPLGRGIEATRSD